MHGAADRDPLTLATGELGDGAVHRDADTAKADGVQKDVLGDRLLLLDVDEAEAIGDLPTDEKVTPERLLIRKRAVLIDCLDREIVGHAHGIVSGIDRSIANEEPPRGRRHDAGHHLDERRLAGAVIAD